MKEFALVSKHENAVSVILDAGEPAVMTIGQKMEAINEMAYMNGYNWAAFLEHYARANHPHLAEGLESDPEGGGYYAHYEVADEDKAKAFAGVINNLLANPDAIYAYLTENGHDIEWD